ncbi:Uncharacterized protein Adt_14964 [Abeliophyllum distichum]|uniref:Uncharacterized protein n=1 Tax=Abeliophyllum distichum TaxID=126358 RepID=A0ABD1U143_9LAMI
MLNYIVVDEEDGKKDKDVEEPDKEGDDKEEGRKIMQISLDGLIESYTCDLIKPLVVTMANGRKLESGSIYPPLIWKMQGMEFQYKLRSSKFGGSDMVLGVYSLSQFSPVTFDFIQGHISFVSEGKKVTLHSEATTCEFEMITGPH